jgi:hypothetical protein
MQGATEPLLGTKVMQPNATLKKRLQEIRTGQLTAEFAATAVFASASALS